MSFPNITADLSDANRDKSLADVKDVWSVLSFLVNISDDDKRAIPKMGPKSIGWVEKCLEYAAANPQFLPPYLAPQKLSGDVNLAKQLGPIVDAVNQLHSALDSTYAVVGSEAYVESLSFYNSVRDAAKRNIPGAKAIYDDLQKRFPGRSKGNGGNPTPTSPSK